MKAQLVAVLLAVAACSNSQTSNAVPRVPARGEWLVDNYTPAASTDTATASQAESTGATTTTAAHVHSTNSGASREDEHASGELPNVHVTEVRDAPRELPLPTPRPVNTGDPCGWCR